VQQVTIQLQQLLSQIQAEEPVENQLLELLAHYEPTRQEMRTQLDRSNDSDRTTKGIGFAPLLGDNEPQPKPQFKCPHCDYTWSRLKLGKPTPFCPIHKILLKPIL
jgi:transposase-like protein